MTCLTISSRSCPSRGRSWLSVFARAVAMLTQDHVPEELTTSTSATIIKGAAYNTLTSGRHYYFTIHLIKIHRHINSLPITEFTSRCLIAPAKVLFRSFVVSKRQPSVKPKAVQHKSTPPTVLYPHSQNDCSTAASLEFGSSPTSLACRCFG